ncbi:MAG: glycosyltransferase family 39 protein, partial [Anaerolineae bacterium]
DVALMGNMLYLFVLLFSVYGIGRKMYGRGVGLLAAFAVSTYPILFNLSRTAYPDFALTAMVALSISLLTRADGFRNRTYSLLWGLSLGLGLLTKWPFLAFVGGPAIYLFLRSGVLLEMRPNLKRKASGLPGLIRSPWFHGIWAAFLTFVWFLPNRDHLPQFALGVWLLPISWLLLWATFFFTTRPASQGTNLLSALSIGAVVGSIWSLPNIGFLRRVFFIAYSRGNAWGRLLNSANPLTYTRYLSIMAGEHLGGLYFALFLLAILVLAYPRLKPLSWKNVLRPVSGEMGILLLWLVLPYFVFTLSRTESPRFLVPALPAVALITARGAMRLRRVGMRALLLALVVAGGLTQFFALSFDELAWLREKATTDLPMIGEVSLLARGRYIQLPASGETDRRYWIGPQVVDLIRQDMLSRGWERVGVSLLINAPYFNYSTFKFLTYGERGMEWCRLDEPDSLDRPLLLRLFECDYLVSVTGTEMTPAAGKALRMREESPLFFDEIFDSIWRYLLPDGNTVSLLGKRYRLKGEYDLEDYRRLAEDLASRSQEGEGIVFDPPEQVEVFARYYEGPLYPYPLARENGIERRLEGISDEHERLWALFWDEGKSSHLIESWLNQHGFRAWDGWYGALRLALYGTPARLPPRQPLNVNLEDGITLLGYSLAEEEVRAGEIIRLTLFWREEAEVDERYKVFVHLLNGQGRLLAQRDSEPVGGSTPTTTWVPGEVVADNCGVLLPEDLPPADYHLLVGIYLPSTGERLSVLGDEGEVVGDSIALASVQVVSE